jgi:YebC/PmpR family DNA-binding regulatory protein
MGRAFEFRKARKFKRWAAMAKTFTRIGKEIVMAVKSGGPDVDSNARLRAVIQNAKAANMPKDNVLRAIKNASDKDTSNFKEITYEGYGPHGIAIVVDCATDNHVRTVANLRSDFKKCNGTLGDSGSVIFMFDHTCNFKILKGDLDPEELELDFIDHGADEIFIEDENIIIYGTFESFGAIQGALEEKGIDIISSGFERIPTATKELAGEQEEDMNKLLQRLDEDDDVLNVYHSMI